MEAKELRRQICKKVILDELQEQMHPELVEDVLFWALEFYAERKKPQTQGKSIAYCIIKRILEEEAEFDQSQTE